MINKDILAGKWHEYLGRAKEKWAELTEDDLLGIEGDLERLAGLLQQSYGYSKEEAKREVKDFLTKL